MSYSHDIIIEAWTPTAGHIPEDGADSLGNYSGYELLDEAAASIVVSPNYVPGTELVLKLHEATASVIKAHKWQASVKLNGGTAQVFTEQFTAGASGDVMTYWSIAISASGHIHTVAVAGNDVVEITLSRVAATSNEDPNIIRLYAVSVGEALADVLIGGCAGRVGKLVDRVLRQSKESRGTFFTTANIVAMINECLTDLAMEGAWPKSVDVDVVADYEGYVHWLDRATGKILARARTKLGSNDSEPLRRAEYHLQKFNRLAAVFTQYAFGGTLGTATVTLTINASMIRPRCPLVRWPQGVKKRMVITMIAIRPKPNHRSLRGIFMARSRCHRRPASRPARPDQGPHR